MKTRLPLFLLPILLLFLAFQTAPVQADTGPKPGMTFILQFDGPPVKIVSAEQLECQDAAGTNCQPLAKLGPQGFSCTETTCSSTAYSYAPYHKLVIVFNDKTRESNVFATAGFSSSYQVGVRGADLLVSPAGSNPNPIVACIAMPISLLVELIVAGLYLLILRLPKRILAWVVLVNLLTLPLVWFAFPLLPLPALWVTVLSELFAFLGEALLLFWLSRGRLSWVHALALSLLMNAASFGVGLLINFP